MSREPGGGPDGAGLHGAGLHGAGPDRAGHADTSERLARMALSRLVEPGDPRIGRLVAAMGAVALHRRLAAERDVDGVLTDVAARLAGVDPVADLAAGRRQGFRFLVPGDAEWPTQLDDLGGVAALQARGGAPLGLWAIGPLDLSRVADSVAIVGSRSATTYGTEVAGRMAAVVGRSGPAVVSGAAFGIDQAAHRGALAESAPTIAVMAGGLDRFYPAAHDGLIRHIAEVGAVISEVPPGSAPTRHRFLARNRLIAALTRGTVVVEAAVRSGALSTANWADRLSRVVMGVPGPVTSASSEGVHELIRRGASLVTDGREVLELVGRPGEHLVTPARGPEGPRDRLGPRQQQVLDAVPVARAASAVSIARTCGIGVGEVGATLTTLVDLALVEALPGSGGPGSPVIWRLGPAAR